MDGAYIKNDKNGKVLDVQSGQDTESRSVWVWKKHGGINQQWDIVYVDEWKDEPKKGEMNSEWGFRVESPFHIVSELPSHRYLDVLGSNIVIKTPNGMNTQTWYFDQKTKTVKNKKNNYSLDI